MFTVVKRHLALWLLVVAQICVLAHSVIPHHHHDGVVAICFHHEGTAGHADGEGSGDEHCCSFSDLQYTAEDHHGLECVEEGIVSVPLPIQIQPLVTAFAVSHHYSFYSDPHCSAIILRGPPAC